MAHLHELLLKRLDKKVSGVMVIRVIRLLGGKERELPLRKLNKDRTKTVELYRNLSKKSSSFLEQNVRQFSIFL